MSASRSCAEFAASAAAALAAPELGTSVLDTPEPADAPELDAPGDDEAAAGLWPG
jgi:hypothetical protein